MNQNLTAERGDTNIYDFTVTRGGVAVNLATAKVWFTVKSALGDVDTAAVIRKGTGNTGLSGVTLPGGGTDGVYRVTIAPADTSSMADGHQWFLYDTQIIEADGRVTTVARGNLVVRPDVTKAVT